MYVEPLTSVVPRRCMHTITRTTPKRMNDNFVEANNGCIAINADKNGKLITALRTVVENGEGMLDRDH